MCEDRERIKWKEDGERKASRVVAIPQISNYASLSADPAARPTNHSTHVPTYSPLPASLPAPLVAVLPFRFRLPPSHSSSLLTLLVVRSPALRFSISLVVLYGYSMVVLVLKPPSHSPCAVTNSTHTPLPPRLHMSKSPSPSTALRPPNPTYSLYSIRSSWTHSYNFSTHARRQEDSKV